MQNRVSFIIEVSNALLGIGLNFKGEIIVIYIVDIGTRNVREVGDIIRVLLQIKKHYILKKNSR